MAHGNFPTSRWEIEPTCGHAAANARMYCRFVGDRTFMPGELAAQIV